MASKKKEEVVDAFKGDCFDIRAMLEDLKAGTQNLKKHALLKSISNPEQMSEIIANIQLAYRHLEDARMRIGKVIQAYDGGTSIYSR